MKNKYLYTAILIFVVFSAVKAQNTPKREMRAVWIATVENIDWPSMPALPVSAQKQEMTELLDLVKDYHLNTVILQIRPAADAFYVSSLEPWSRWLTGEQGKAPEPFYDPLAFTISECRKRGLDIHVWLNPYRALRDTAMNITSPDHVNNTHPEWLLTYGSTKYFDPGLPQARDHVSRVVSDIVRRYDVDAIHMDDYFYPYRLAGKNFPDDQSFAAYRGNYSDDQRDDWRRNNVDLIIKQLHDSIKAIKPYMEFGISPFGVWRNSDKDPAGSATKAGQTNYDDLFADVLKWQKEGWIDYVAPQLYWHIGFKVADYAVLSEWWNKNTFGCPLYIGQAFYRLDRRSKTKAWRSSKEILRQIELNRSMPDINGSIFFSAKYLRANPLRLRQRLIRKVYFLPALTPVNSRVSAVTPGIPINATITVQKDTLRLAWECGNNTRNFIIYKFRDGKVPDFSSMGNVVSITSGFSVGIKNGLKTNPDRYYYVLTSQSVTKTESEPVYFREE